MLSRGPHFTKVIAAMCPEKLCTWWREVWSTQETMGRVGRTTASKSRTTGPEILSRRLPTCCFVIVLCKRTEQGEKREPCAINRCALVDFHQGDAWQGCVCWIEDGNRPVVLEYSCRCMTGYLGRRSRGKYGTYGTCSLYIPIFFSLQYGTSASLGNGLNDRKPILHQPLSRILIDHVPTDDLLLRLLDVEIVDASLMVNDGKNIGTYAHTHHPGSGYDGSITVHKVASRKPGGL